MLGRALGGIYRPVVFISVGRSQFPVNGLATSVHLCFDLFPKRWYGYALIHIPFMAAGMPKLCSIAWITTSILVCLYAALFLIKDMPEFILCLAVLGLVFWVAAITEKVIEGRAIILPAGGVLVVGTLIAVAIPHRLLKKT